MSQTASQIEKAERAREATKSALDNARMHFRFASGNKKTLAGRLATAETRRAECASAIQNLTRAEQAIGAIPTTVLQRLRGRTPSDYGGRGIAFATATPGTHVRELVAGLLAHAREHHEAIGREVDQLRGELEKVEADVAKLAARVEELAA